MTLADPISITRLVADQFDKLGIPYFVAGSLASSLHGIPRATADSDIVAGIENQHIHSLVQELKADFYVDEGSIKRAVRNQSSFNLIHLSTIFKVDVFILKADVYSKEEMARREKHRVTEKKGEELYLASAEDIILSKLQRYKSSGEVSDRQWTDVLGVLRVQGKNLDIEFLKDAAAKRGLENLLQDALAESEA